jgi:[protein-PII] uridylyltransferase
MPFKLDLKSRFQRTIDKSHSVNGRLLSRQLTYIIDAEIFKLYNQILKDKFPILKDKFTILSIGGYGRMELAPHSDLDILYLHDGLDDDILISVISEINTFLFDSGKKVGHSCRTIQECFDSLDNINTFYSMIDSRYICGSEKLFFKYNTDFLRMLPSDILKKYNQSKLEALSSLLNSELPLLVSEPNLKHGPLGLRDMQSIYWIEKSINFIPSLSGLAVLPAFTRGEVQELESAYDFFLRARIALHRLQNYQTDRIEITLQPLIAEFLGFGKQGDISAIDKMMNVLYSHQKVILSFIGVYLDYKSDKTNYKSFISNDIHFVENGVALYPPSNGNLFGNPETIYGDIMYVFYTAHKLDLDISNSLLNEIKFACIFLQEDFKNSNIAIDLFLKILRESKKIGKILTLMHRSNVLGKFIPEFGTCTNFSLFSYHHQYPVDEHSLLILRELDRLLQNQFEDEEVQNEFRFCKHIDILALCILIHDAGKVKEGDHCQYGTELASAVGERLGLSEDEIELLRFLVGVHILMSELTTKRDISDPKLISEFAKLIGNEDRLRLLYILTIIDTKSVGPNVLTNWKKSILHSLFIKTKEYLNKKEQFSESSTLELDKEFIKNYLSQKEKIPNQIIDQILDFANGMNPTHYLQYNTARRVLQHFTAYHESRRLGQYLNIETEKEPAFTTITVYSREDQFLLSDITGCISSEGLNVIGMRAYKNDSGFAITITQVSDSFGNGEISDEKIDRFKKNLTLVLEKKLLVDDLLKSPVEWGNYNKIPDGMVPEKVEFNNSLSLDYTILEILLPDSLGLLYRLIKIISSFDLKLDFVRVATSADYAYDSFYLQTKDGNKIEEESIQKKLESEILNVANLKVSTNLTYLSF